ARPGWALRRSAKLVRVGSPHTGPIPTALPVPLGPSKRHLEVFRRGCQLGPAVWLGRNPKSDAAVLADERTTRATSPKTRVVHQRDNPARASNNWRSARGG